MNDQNDHDFTGGDLKAAVTGWTPNRRRFLSVAGLAVGGAVVGTTAAGCGTAQTGNTSGGEGEAKGRAGAAGETLFIAGFQWGPPTSFNPFGAYPAWPTGGGQSQLIYESLLRFNLLDGSLTGGLAKEIQQPDQNTIVLPLQDGTKWSDGSELTAEDVAFTFDLAKQTALSFSTIWNYVDSIEATDARTVTIKIKADPYNPGFVKNVLSHHPDRAQGRVEQDRPGQDHRRHEPGADRFRSVQARQGRSDPDQPDPGRRLLGQGRLRHPGDDRDQPPDLQEQQRR